MKIPSGNGVSKYINQTAVTGTKKLPEKANKPSEVFPDSRQDAFVNFSRRSREVQKAQEVLQSEPDVRSEKVQAVKEKIENGTYEMDYEETAEKMLKAFIDRIM